MNDFVKWISVFVLFVERKIDKENSVKAHSDEVEFVLEERKWISDLMQI